MSVPLVLYHANCWDGFCAAWAARNALGDIEAVPVLYGQPPPDVGNREVYILDFSYPRAVMDSIAARSIKLTVLDHHKTAAEALDGFCGPDGDAVVIFDMNKSGGRLTWEFFHPDITDSRVPWLVEYTEDRDLWRHALVWSREVNAALRSYPLDFGVWDELAKRPVSTLLLEGEAIRRIEQQMVQQHVKNARLTSFDGTHTIPVVNATVLFSEIAGELAKGFPFGACYFDRADGKRQWSLRSDDLGLDVSEIAKAHGGGGHVHAAGFEEVIP